ncbi:MAG: proline dehydrogenase family protein [Gemmatimonadota bacterium]
MRSALLWGSQNRWLEHQFRRRRFAKKAVSRFMPGERPEDALGEARSLSEKGISTVVTCLGENVATVSEVDAVVQHYLDTMERVEALGLPTHISVKLTHMGLDQGQDVAIRNLSTLAARAARLGHTFWVDMEYSRYVDATLDVFEAARAQHPNLALCLQAYLHRTPEDLERIAGAGAAVRLVKGAYAEPPEVAMPRKADVDASFERLALRLIELYGGSGQVPGVATHDVPLLRRIAAAASRQGWGNDRFEVQMLYGIQRAAQLQFAGEGFPTRVLISYGEAWFPWYMRRLAERPANVGFVLRSMLGG